MYLTMSCIFLYIFGKKAASPWLFFSVIFTNTPSYPHLKFPHKSSILFEKEGGICNDRNYTKRH